jgi:hypothetical protein
MGESFGVCHLVLNDSMKRVFAMKRGIATDRDLYIGILGVR